jgi:uncharacterized repeat protein (TIGR04138 family)
LALGEWIHRFIGRFTGAKPDGKLRCIKCQRELTGLPADAKCPDCGEPVLSSVLRAVPAVPEEAEDANAHPSRTPFEFVREQTGYPVDAYLFIADVLMRIRKLAAERKGLAFSNTRHVSVAKLGEGLREYAVDYFGDNAEARGVLATWNVLASEDVGKIVWRMVGAGLLAASAHDPAEKFSGGFTLETLFGADGIS